MDDALLSASHFNELCESSESTVICEQEGPAQSVLAAGDLPCISLGYSGKGILMVRFKSLAAAFLLGLASLSSSYAEDAPGAVRPAAVQHLITNSEAAWELQVQLNHPDGIYQLGERMTIKLSSPNECYVHIVNVNPNGEVNVLWPMDSRTSNRVSPGQEVVFPDRGVHPNFVFEAAAPVGKELIVCFATKAPLNLKSAADARMFVEFLDEISTISPNPLTRLRSFVTKIEPDKTGWTATAFELETREKSADLTNHPEGSSGDTQEADPCSLPLPGVPPKKPATALPETETHAGLPEAANAESTGLLIATKGNVSVRFPGRYRTETPTIEVDATLNVKTTITTQTTPEGLFLFADTVITTPVDYFDAQAALSGITGGWKEQFNATDDQIKPITHGRLVGCEFVAAGSDGITKKLKAFVDPQSRACYILGSIGTASFVDGTEAAAFMKSLKVLH